MFATPANPLKLTATLAGEPSDSYIYPNVVLVDPQGTELPPMLGHATADASTYEATWYVPADAILGPWRARWLLVDTTGAEQRAEYTIEVLDSASLDEDDPAGYCVDPSDPIDIGFDLPPHARDVRVEILNVQSNTPARTFAQHELNQYTLPDRLRVRAILPHGLGLGVYQIKATYKKTAMSGLTAERKLLYILGANYRRLQPGLVEALDLLQKSKKSIFAYEEYEFAAAMVQGIFLLNGYQPVTSWLPWSYPTELDHWVHIASLISALRSRMIAAKETQFSYGGQEIDLSLNRGDDYASIISDLEQTLDDFKEAKVQQFLNSTPPAYVAVMGNSSPSLAGFGRHGLGYAQELRAVTSRGHGRGGLGRGRGRGRGGRKR